MNLTLALYQRLDYRKLARAANERLSRGTTNRLNAWVHNLRPRQPVSIPWEKKDHWLQGTDQRSVDPFIVPNDDDGIVAEETEGLNGARVQNVQASPYGEAGWTQRELL